MKHPNFSVKRIEGFRCKPGKGQSIYWDGYEPGLGLRVTAAGSKSYIFEAWLHGRTLRLTIGDLRTWTLGNAQKEAKRLKVLTDQGIDPRRVKAERQAADLAARAKDVSGAALVGDAWAVYLAHHKKRWTRHHMSDHQFVSQAGGEKKKRGKGLTKPGALAPLMHNRLADVSAAVLIEWLIQEKAMSGNRARQGFELFRTFWRWAATRADYKSVIDPRAIDDKDLRAEVPPRKTKKFDVLERAHLKPWFAAVRGLTNPIVSAYLQALILTGARREEIGELKWSDVDFQWKSLWIKDKVAEEGRKIPLTPYLAQQLAALPRENQWVFSSPAAKNGRIAEPRIPHNRALAVAGLKHLTLHGLRRTFASLAEWVEIPKGVVAQIQGHVPSATAEKHYINRPLELLALWHDKYEAWLLRQAGIKPPRSKRTAQAKPAAQPRLRLVGSR